MAVAEIRQLIPDLPQYERVTAVGDGVSVDYPLTNSPVVTNSQTVYVAGAVKATPADYTIDGETGVVSFVAAPALGAEVLVSYKWTLLSDASITTHLTVTGTDLLAAALALETIAAQTVLVMKVITILDVSINGAAMAQQLLARAKALRSVALDATSTDGFDVIEMLTTTFVTEEYLYNQALKSL